MIKTKKKEINMKVQWIKCTVVMALYLAFLYWVGSLMGLIVVPFIFDAYITRKINWQWWQESESSSVRFVMSWVDAIVFALVAVYFINQFVFQNYVIPSSSLEKSLLTGDYLCVSKVSYGPRIPETPLTVPLTQHTMPIGNLKSYSEWPHWDYRRVKGLGNVQLNDIVVFNYPAGDTILAEMPYQTMYEQLCYSYGKQVYMAKNFGIAFNPNETAGGIDAQTAANFTAMTRVDSLSGEERYRLFAQVKQYGKEFLATNKNVFGEISTRPTDRRENYVKRCVGLPGQTLQIKNRVIYLDGKANKEPERVQYLHQLELADNTNSYTYSLEQYDDMWKDLDVSREDMDNISAGYMPLTKEAKEVLLQHKELFKGIKVISHNSTDGIYPQNSNLGWTCDNYGPIWIPKKGESIKLTLDNLAIYERPIRAYEHNTLDVKDGKIYINGKQTDTYTFKLDYYWMQGDNRHLSADSRYWGFVPEDHIVGKPLFVWLSLDKDRTLFGGKIRWKRMFRSVESLAGIK